MKPETLRATLHTTLDVAGPVEEWLPHMMNTIATQSNIPLQQQSLPQGLSWNHWAPIHTFEGRWTGQVLVQLQNQQDLQTLHQHTNNRTLQILGHTAALYCASDCVDL